MTLYDELCNLKRDLKIINKYNLSINKIQGKTKDIFESYKNNHILQNAIKGTQSIENKFEELYESRTGIVILPEKKLNTEYINQVRCLNELISAHYLDSRKLGIILRPITVLLTVIFSMGNSFGSFGLPNKNWCKEEAKYIDDKIKKYMVNLKI
ncbi:hypothetical protein K9L67_02860 [Candidatus Woesearchaeota archaeon]|nr:hypothetical protein [Candidatus Woesearchaeota archaeon]MCF7901142.1 hypothetical protein [Candidatus Woesearchaeota archaeon]MCF8013681.1 hypothetical protein [Candidatus Woesearchaeota archaeon]